MHYYYSKPTKRSVSKVHRFSSISSQKNRENESKNLRIENKEGKKLEENPLSKEHFKTSFYFFKDKRYNNNCSDYNKLNASINNHNKESNRRYLTIEDNNGFNQCITKEINKRHIYENKNLSHQLKRQNCNHNYITIKNRNKNNEYYEDNSGYSENNYNFNECYGNEITNDNELVEENLPTFKNNRFSRNKNIYPSSTSSQSKRRKKFISKVINTESNFSEDKKIRIKTIKKNIQNFGNSTTTTNNTYNNNIYYINPINVKSKLKEKLSPLNINKCFDNNLHQRARSHYKDFYKMNNKDKSKYVNAAILIQSIFRAYLIKMKICNYINLCYFCDKGIEIIEHLFLNRKNFYFSLFKNNINSKIFSDNSLRSSFFSNSIRSRMKSGDIEEIIINPYKRKNKETRLRRRLSDVINENSQLKVQLFDLKYNEENLKSLINENKKLKYINEIILKDNRKLTQKLKDIHKFKNNKLIIQNQTHFCLGINQELNKKNEVYLNKLKKFMADKLIYKKFTNNNNLAEEKINKQRGNIKIKGNDLKKTIYLKNLINIIEKIFQSKINKYFWNLYKYYKYKKEKEIKELLLENKLKKLLYKKEKENLKILRKIFFKFMVNNIKYDNEHLKALNKEDEKILKLKKIFNKYEKDVELISKFVLKQWNLKSKIMGMRATAKDKKKKRKEKKKINKLYHKYIDSTEKNKSTNNLDLKISEHINLFKTITSNVPKDKEFLSNKFDKFIAKNNLNYRYNTINSIKDENNEENKIRNMKNRFNNNENNI